MLAEEINPSSDQRVNEPLRLHSHIHPAFFCIASYQIVLLITIATVPPDRHQTLLHLARLHLFLPRTLLHQQLQELVHVRCRDEPPFRLGQRRHFLRRLVNVDELLEEI